MACSRVMEGGMVTKPRSSTADQCIHSAARVTATSSAASSSSRANADASAIAGARAPPKHSAAKRATAGIRRIPMAQADRMGMPSSSSWIRPHPYGAMTMWLASSKGTDSTSSLDGSKKARNRTERLASADSCWKSAHEWRGSKAPPG
eukprot:scaffold3837_cov110-Isochrysis_galbana.AAC.2